MKAKAKESSLGQRKAFVLYLSLSLSLLKYIYIYILFLIHWLNVKSVGTLKSEKLATNKRRQVFLRHHFATIAAQMQQRLRLNGQHR